MLRYLISKLVNNENKQFTQNIIRKINIFFLLNFNFPKIKSNANSQKIDETKIIIIIIVQYLSED